MNASEGWKNGRKRTATFSAPSMHKKFETNVFVHAYHNNVKAIESDAEFRNRVNEQIVSIAFCNYLHFFKKPDV